jgi:hypothetical protein
MQDDRDRTKVEENVAAMEDLLNKSQEENGLAKAEDATGIEIADFQVVDKQLQAEVLTMVQGMYETSVCYNYPKTTRTGQKSWKACKRMPNGYCKYDGKESHIHVVDVGVKGAIIAAQAYGGLTFGPLDRPTVVEIAGINYWVVECQCVDTVRNLAFNRWQFQEYLQQSGNTYKPLEYGAAIVQSKGIRNVILAIVPPQLRRMWVNDYLNGNDEFDPHRIMQLEGGRLGVGAGRGKASLPPSTSRGKATEPGKKRDEPPAKEKKEEKSADQKARDKAMNGGEQTLEAMLNPVATALGTKPKRLKQYTTTMKTLAQATLKLVNANKDPVIMAALKKKFDAWDKKTGDEAGDEDIGMEE